jgi:tetratricopeptide (TPR) repeat protein
VAGSESRELANCLYDLALVVRDQGKPAEAEAMLREALAINRKMLRSGHPRVIWSLQELSKVLREQGKIEEADALLREVRSITPKSAKPGPDEKQ